MNAIEDRRSVRKYKDKAVDREDIDRIIEAGISAPSAKNRQPWRFIVFTGDKKSELLSAMEKGLIREQAGGELLPRGSKAGIADAFHTLKIMREAPVLIIIENANGSSPFEQFDSDGRVTEICDSLSIGACVQNMLLTAAEMGYGTLWIANTFFAYKEMAEHIGIRGQLICAVSLGYADETPNPRPRKGIEEVREYR
ncbi:MAG: nitroreductase family protein [Ruminococcus sp.]|nr:nitroreductase family protein [Ruminococcus sp.]